MASCVSPYNLKDGQKVPCGRCSNCVMRRVNSWAHRLAQEWKNADSGHFVTLTYNTTTVPITDNHFMTLRKVDFQKFMKRLRSRHTGKKIVYYACGEYGTKTKRPHYHAIILNAQLDDIISAWSYVNESGTRCEIGRWHVGDVNDATIYYTLKYMHKDYRYKKSFDRDDREREFSLMSKGIGKCYVDDVRKRSFHRDNMASYVVHTEGYKSPMPRYYKDKFFSKEEQEEMVIKSLFEYRMKEDENVKNLLKQYGDDLPRVLHERKVRNFEKLNNFSSRSKF